MWVACASEALCVLHEKILHRESKLAAVSDDLVIRAFRQAGRAREEPQAFAVWRSDCGGGVVAIEPDDEVVALPGAGNEDREPFIEAHFEHGVGPGIDHGRGPLDLLGFAVLQSTIHDGHGTIVLDRILSGGFDTAALEEHGQPGHLMPLPHVTGQFDLGNGGERFHGSGGAGTQKQGGHQQQGCKDWVGHGSRYVRRIGCRIVLTPHAGSEQFGIDLARCLETS